MSQLESLQTVAALGLLPDDVKDRVHQLGSLGVVTLGPVVAGPGLAEDKVVRPEESSVGSTAHTVHGAGLQVNQHSPGHVLPPAGLVVVHVDPLQLEVRLPGVGASRVNTVLITSKHKNFCE